jgi:endonuclease VIII-like 1
MPEGPEIYIMSEFFNEKLENCEIVKIEKSPMSKNHCDFSVMIGKKWKVKSSSRGKEMMIKIDNTLEHFSLKIGFARIGYLQYYSLDEIPEDFDKNAMLRFYTESHVMCLCDYTRFSQWRWCNTWDPARSPDIVLENNDWRDNLYKWRKLERFKKPIFDLILDQRYFNGVGNFSRAEILCRTKCSPFMSFNEILESDELRTDFFIVAKETLTCIIEFGGLQFKHWKNPFDMDKQKFNKWVRCFNKHEKSYYQRDSKGRMFWFLKTSVPEYLIWARKKALADDEVQDTRLLEKIYKHISIKQK